MYFSVLGDYKHSADSSNYCIKYILDIIFNFVLFLIGDLKNTFAKMENDEDDDMGLQLALKKARKLKQLETLEKKSELTEFLVVIIIIPYFCI